MSRFFLSALLSVFLFSSCSSTSTSEPKATASKSKKTPATQTERARLARAILNHPRISLMKIQVSGRNDKASAYHNILSAANGYAAKRSSYGTAPGGYRHLDVRMLRGMKKLADMGYSFKVTSILGGSHSRKSRHYVGTAFDVNWVNGKKVGRRGCPHWRFQKAARSLGATEVLGPGKRGHSTHVHVAWPRK